MIEAEDWPLREWESWRDGHPEWAHHRAYWDVIWWTKMILEEKIRGTVS